MKYVGLFATALVSIFTTTILSGYVISLMWKWFVVPVFNLPVLSIPYAIGLAMLIGYITYREIKTKEDEENSIGIRISVAFLTSLFRGLLVLITAWVVTLFI